MIPRVTNQDDTAEELDSTPLQMEKLIVAGHYGLVRLRPPGPGRYRFLGEYHAKTAKGVVVSEQERAWLIQPAGAQVMAGPDALISLGTCGFRWRGQVRP